MRSSSILALLFVFNIFAAPNQSLHKDFALGIHDHRLKNFAGKKNHLKIVKQSIDEPRPKQEGLSKVEANRRSQMISNISYDIDIDVSKNMKKNRFHGVSKIFFDFKKLKGFSGPVTIDFTGGKVKSVWINNWPSFISRKKEKGVHYNGFFISIPQSRLKEGRNKVKVRYHHEYDMDDPELAANEQEMQLGLHRIVEDFEGKKRNYLYTQFEVYAANRMFPCFDQPDLKADYELSVKAPADWHVISAENPKIVSEGGNSKLWSFPKTNTQFSTYLFSLHAGPFRRWEGETYKNRIPMSLYVRQSQAKQFTPQVEAWFKATEEGFAFFEKYFGIEYPFNKYDQVIVSEFGAGAMENVGAVTFREEYFVINDEIRADAQKLAARERYIVMVILHEMTHMWFGNLVTMKWWGDLWLNESFATYFPLLAMKESSIITSGQDRYFHLSEKMGAYGVDNGSKDAIATSVTDTVAADTIFDQIRYNKGASVLRQLSYYMGGDSFQVGIQNYLDQNKYRNTKADDFFFSMNDASVMELSEWFKNWFQKRGYNVIEADYKCSNGLISDFSINQEFGTSDILRSHRTSMVLYKDQGSALGQQAYSQVSDFYYEGTSTEIPKVLGEKCPDFVLLNSDDQDYVKVRLNSASKSNLNSLLESPQSLSGLNRAMLEGNSIEREVQIEN